MSGSPTRAATTASAPRLTATRSANGTDRAVSAAATIRLYASRSGGAMASPPGWMAIRSTMPFPKVAAALISLTFEMTSPVTNGSRTSSASSSVPRARIRTLVSRTSVTRLGLMVSSAGRGVETAALPVGDGVGTSPGTVLATMIPTPTTA